MFLRGLHNSHFVYVRITPPTAITQLGNKRKRIMNTELKNELVAEFKSQIISSVKFQFNRLHEIFGPTFRGVYNSKHYSLWSLTVRPCTKRLGDRMNDEIVLCEDNMNVYAQEQAELFADELIAKVNVKAGELTESKVLRVSGANFRITGMKDDKKVMIEQNQIINVSVKGKLFNQFPARIYVDGKFHSAAAFKKI